MLWRMVVAYLVVNFLPHILVTLLAGKVSYYELGYPFIAVFEAVMMALNLTVPALILWRWPADRLGAESICESLGWRKPHWRRAVAMGGLGFVTLILWMHVNKALFGEPFPWGGGGYSVGGIAVSSLSELVGLLALVCGLLLALVGLLLITTLGEETMFRGYMQTLLTRRYGAVVGLAIPALCFALRHLPSDLYWASVAQATPTQWAARLGELVAAALVLGLVRHFGRTTAASWVTHAIMWFMMLFGLYSLFGLQ